MKFQGINLPLLVYAGPFPLWIIFFFLGVFLSNKDRNYNIVLPAIMTAIGLILQIIEYHYWMGYGSSALGIKLSSFIFSSGVILLLFSKKAESRFVGNILFRTVNWIGGISFGIYLLHCYLIIVVSKLLPEISWIGNWILVLGLTVIIIWIAKAIFPKFSIKYLGFR